MLAQVRSDEPQCGMEGCSVFPIAQTNVQLYNQLRHAGWSVEDLTLVRHAYSLAMRLYSGHYQADGRPFVNHSAGVASIVAHLGLPAEIVAAACIHNVYGNGDFGDGREHCVTDYRQQLVRAAVGAEVEELVCRFRELRLTRLRMEAVRRLPETLSARDRQLVVMDLADMLELFANLGVLYFGDHQWATGRAAESGVMLVEIAECLGYPQLGIALKEAFAAATLESVPAVLRSEPEWKFLRLIVPMSCRVRPSVTALRAMQRLLFAGRSSLRQVLARLR